MKLGRACHRHLRDRLRPWPRASALSWTKISLSQLSGKKSDSWKVSVKRLRTKWMIWSDRQKYASSMNSMRSSKHIQMSAKGCEANLSRLIRKTYFKKKRCWRCVNYLVNRASKHRVRSSNSLQQMLLWSRPSYRSTLISMIGRTFMKRPSRTTLARFQWYVSQLRAPIWPSTTQYTRSTATSMWLNSLASFRRTRSLISRWSSYLC